MVPHARVAVWPWLLAPALLLVIAPGGCAALSDGTGSQNMWDGAGGGIDGNPMPGGDASACRPGDVETYQPGDYHSATAAWQGVCNRARIAGFYSACLDPSQATLASCMAFRSDPVAGPCAACILTSDTLPHYGPLIDHHTASGDFITTNVAGCLELTDPKSRTCSKSLQALDGCELAACEANCPVDDKASLAAYSACVTLADQSGCQSYATVASVCVGSEADAGLVADCLISTFAEFYTAVVPLFCGPPPADSGAPPYDASVDVAVAVEASADAQGDASGGGGSDARGDARADARADAPADAPADAQTDGPSDAPSADGD